MIIVNWKFIKQNLTQGCFTWNGYVANNKPDVKFGHNTFDYVCQIPLFGLIFVAWLEVVFILARPIFWLTQLKDNRHVKA